MRWIALIFVVLAQPGLAEVISGKPSFSDADTLKVAGVTIRLFGIDAPELDQTCTKADGREWACGTWAADQARSLFRREKLVCKPIESDRYGRTVATCYAGGVDIAETLVRLGIATAYLKYSDTYLTVEKQASLAGIGIWQGDVIAPEQHRAAKLETLAVTNAASGPGDCVIKGNISGSGRIFHVPGQENYAKTVISPGKGERWFCTEAEAQAAGWRKAKR